MHITSKQKIYHVLQGTRAESCHVYVQATQEFNQAGTKILEIENAAVIAFSFFEAVMIFVLREKKWM